MYIVLVNYTAPTEEIAYALPDHGKWLTRQYTKNLFLASGRQDTHTGDVIIARPMLRGKLDAVLATDPFALRHLACYEVIDFSATQTAVDLGEMNESPTQRVPRQIRRR